MRGTLTIKVLSFVCAVILLQTLYFKFTAADESVWIFTQLGFEPTGRILTGVAEFFAAVLLLWPGRAVWGAILSAGIMAGAILSHILVLGIAVKGDGGLLFSMAMITFVFSMIIIFLRRQEIRTVILKGD